ncbi:phage terminase large subunit [Dermabacteraceae bacterium P7006]
MAAGNWLEYAARAFEEPAKPRPRWDTPGALAQSLDPRINQTPALRMIDNALVRLYNTPDSRLIISMPPQEGKSERAVRAFVTWCLSQNPTLRVAIASYGHAIARRWGRVVRDDITTHTDRLGLTVRNDLSAQHEWQLKEGKGGVFTTGIGGALTGRPVDLMVIDDPVSNREQADSHVYRDRAWTWWTDVASTRLAPGAPVLLIMTRWHEDDLAGRLLKGPDAARWEVLNIPAEAYADDDPLGREPGVFMESARGRTRKDWERIKVQAGPTTWAALYQGNPTPDETRVFPSVWPRYTTPLWTLDDTGARRTRDMFDTTIQSWDLAFKGGPSSDYVVGQVWGRKDSNTYLLDMVRARLDFDATLAAIRDMSTRWPDARTILVEDKANGPAVITTLSKEIPGIIPVQPDGGKYARAIAVQPYTAAGNVHLPAGSLLPVVTELTEETNGFPNAAHDDTVDALTQALNHLYHTPALDDLGQVYTAADLLGDDFSPVDLGDY